MLVNPLQGLHPNAGAPADTSLVDGGRRAHFDRAAYTEWLKRLREVCTERNIVLIFDEVFVGFRLAPGGAQEYFGVKADMVTYGKTLGGGLPIGAVCGRRDLMKRFRDDRPADICFARGTFNSHPYVMGAMHEFLQRIDTPEIRALYRDLDATWNRRAEDLNRRLREAELPVEVANVSSIWTVSYTRASRYNWMLQFYLRAQGLALSWIGTGRLIFSLNYTDADFQAVAERFVAAAKAMQADGWWWADASATNKSIKRHILREMIAARFSPRRHDCGLRAGPAGLASSVLRMRHRIDEFAAQQIERRLVVELDVVERVGDDLRHPHQARLHVLEEEQVHGAEDEAADADGDPHQGDMVHEGGDVGVRLEDAEQAGIEIEHQRRQGPDRHQHHLAPQVVAELDVFLVLVRRVVDRVVRRAARRRNARSAGWSCRPATPAARRRRDWTTPGYTRTRS